MQDIEKYRKIRYINFDMNDLRSIFNEKVNIADIMDEAGLLTNGNTKKIHCPSKDHLDDHESASIKNNKCHCFSCNASFRPFDIYMEYLAEGNFKDKILNALDRYGIDIEDVVEDREELALQLYNAEHSDIKDDTTKNNEDVFPYSNRELSQIGLVAFVTPKNVIDIDDKGKNIRETDKDNSFSLKEIYKDNPESLYSLVINKSMEKLNNIANREEFIIEESDKVIKNSLLTKEKFYKEYDKYLEYMSELTSLNNKYKEKVQKIIYPIIDKVKTKKELSIEEEKIFKDYKDLSVTKETVYKHVKGYAKEQAELIRKYYGEAVLSNDKFRKFLDMSVFNNYRNEYFALEQTKDEVVKVLEKGIENCPKYEFLSNDFDYIQDLKKHSLFDFDKYVNTRLSEVQVDKNIKVRSDKDDIAR